MTPRMPHLAAPPTQAGVVTADEFNLWCALNGRPFNLVPNPRPDGRVMWDVEVLPGTPRAGTVYSTNLSDEALAVVAGFAFLSGVEWAYEARDPAEAEAPAAAPCEAVPAAAAPVPAPMPAAVAPCAPAAPAEPVEYPAVYSLPAVSLLQNPPPRPVQQHDESVLARNARMLETVLKNFRVRGEIMDVRPGPVVTLYEFEPAPGTKSATVINLTDDIARSMSVVTARIAIVPGRSVIGVELPNPVREMVYLRESFDHDAFRNTTAQLAIALGKDISGEPVVADLARMPHLLVAGTTGSGKSVAINTMILSLLYRLPPERCRFIMVDPKMLELSVYDGIPHLLTPVVTDPKKAVVALRWAVREMESRYEAMSKLGVRNIEGYNARMTEMIAAGEKMPRRTPAPGEPENVFDLTPSEPTPLPYIVVIVDEMADLMLVAGKEIEAAIQRLAQMARAAGIHLIMATQRPSVDVITGTIKANFPTRISFQVTSKIDSRTILGEAGAEQLLGQGDMLYMQGGGRITRVHGPFVSDSEVEEIVQYVKAQGAPNYVTAITEEEEETAAVEDEEGGSAATGDDLYMQAVNLVVREGKVSVSFIQRQLQIGYNRAARLVERMETERVVGPANHQGKREVLLSHAGLSAKRAGV
ncbi:DNA translocase FtsK [Azospirillum sp. TSA2s]|uniref:DNA translocase FtsK n=1 Tax=Azospirillum sp. TSA2s TaxID=709810 RepID=UPI0010A9C974|nr:DNA translocase FtsK [Azospirillum sp. TSA2s]QCG97287.1 DNA translocase FtsK [Azospirillum sp. TSA2s]